MMVKKGLYDSIVVPTVMYGGESWGLKELERKRLNVMEMKCLRNMCGVTCRDTVRNEEVRRRVGMDRSLGDRVDESSGRVWTCEEDEEEGEEDHQKDK